MTTRENKKAALAAHMRDGKSPVEAVEAVEAVMGVCTACHQKPQELAELMFELGVEAGQKQALRALRAELGALTRKVTMAIESGPFSG